MKQHTLQFILIRKAISLGVLVAFLAADSAYTAPFSAFQGSKLAPASHSETQYQEERDAAATLVQARRTTVINYVCSVISVAVFSFLMLMTPLNAEARSSKQVTRVKPDSVAVKTTTSKKKLPVQGWLPEEDAPPTLTQVVMSYINDMVKGVQDGFRERQLAAVRKEAEASVRLGIDTLLNDPFYDFWRDFADPLDMWRRISSEKGTRPRPKNKEGKEVGSSNHLGMDLQDKRGSGAPVFSMMTGTVAKAVDDQGSATTGYGNQVVVKAVKSGKVVEIRSAHLSKVYVEVGESVDAGSLVGEEGSTGASTGPHVHTDFIVDGQFINPAFLFDAESLLERDAEKSAKRRREFEEKYVRLWQLSGKGITLDTAPGILAAYKEIFDLLEWKNDAENVDKAQESLERIKKAVEAGGTGEKGADPQKAIDDFLKYLGMIFGTLTFSSLKRREEEKFEGELGKLLDSGTATPEAVAGLIGKTVVKISEWVRLRGSYIEKLKFSADQLRADMEGRAAQIIAALAPPSKPAEMNSDVVTAALPGEDA